MCVVLQMMVFFFGDGIGNLCNRPEYLEHLFSRSQSLIALHCEDEPTIVNNIEKFSAMYPGGIPIECHSQIRSAEACFKATKQVLDIALKSNARVHILHVSTDAEANLIGALKRITNKRVTGEACIHHLYFSMDDYATLGVKIIWNPSIKSETNRKGLIEALEAGHLDIVSTDHAPHVLSEKLRSYLNIKPGAPSIQHALQALIQLYNNDEKHLPFIVDKTSHSVAQTYNVCERGYVREGYYADLALINLGSQLKTTEMLYRVEWSPFSNIVFGSQVEKTFVNGKLVFSDGKVSGKPEGKRVTFNRNNF